MFTKSFALALVTGLLLSVQSAFAQTDLTNADLLRLRDRIVSRFSSGAVQQHNEKMIASLPLPVEGKSHVQSVSMDFARNLMTSIDAHPITSYFGMEKYNRVEEGVNIGYCFGRAAYVHLALLKNGVDKDAIRKIWAVGPMKTGETSWAFHVSTIVRGEDGEWLAVDNFPGQVLTVREWMAHVSQISTDDKLTFFVTQPSKFSVSLGTYDRVQLGLDIGRNQDWYKHYFLDLMHWFGSKESRTFFDENSVPDLRKASPAKSILAPESAAAQSFGPALN